MNTKVVAKLINTAMRESKSSLTSAVKVFAAMVGNTKDLQDVADILRAEKSINVTKEEIKNIVDLCKNRDELVRVCASMMAKVDETFVTFAVYSKKYDATGIEDFTRSAQWEADNVVKGKEYKAFGDVSPIVKDNGNIVPITRTIERDGCNTIYIAVAVKSYTPVLVAKCIVAYLKSHEEKK